MSWRHPDHYDVADDIVQVLCKVLPYDAGNPPRECNLPISSGDHAVHELFVSVGWQSDATGEWHVAGWNMSQDCWQDARVFEVHGWQPLADTPVVTPIEGRAIASRTWTE